MERWKEEWTILPFNKLIGIKDDISERVDKNRVEEGPNSNDKDANWVYASNPRFQTEQNSPKTMRYVRPAHNNNISKIKHRKK